jgi:uroporphyrinogen decarboxylase
MGTHPGHLARRRNRPHTSRLWQHFPVIDEDPHKLAEASLDFQAKYDWDILKFTPTGTYGIEDWGAETVWKPTGTG